MDRGLSNLWLSFLAFAITQRMLKRFPLLISILWIVACAKTHAQSDSVDLSPPPLKKDQSPKKAPPKKSVKTKAQRKTRTPSKKTPIGSVKNMVARYRSSTGVKMKVNKTLTMGLLQKEKKSEGELFFSKGRLRLDLDKPDKSLLILNGKDIWVVNELPEELAQGKKSPIQVTKIKSQSKKRQKSAILAFLFENLEIWDHFKTLKAIRGRGRMGITLKPLPKAGLDQVLKLHLVLDTKKNELVAFEFWDELENHTRFKFSQIRFVKSVRGSQFKYRPPKGADVTEIN